MLLKLRAPAVSRLFMEALRHLRSIQINLFFPICVNLHPNITLTLVARMDVLTVRDVCSHMSPGWTEFTLRPGNHVVWRTSLTFARKRWSWIQTQLRAHTWRQSSIWHKQMLRAASDKLESPWLASLQHGTWFYWTLYLSLKRLPPLDGTKLQLIWERGYLHHDRRYLWRRVLDFSQQRYWFATCWILSCLNIREWRIRMCCLMKNGGCDSSVVLMQS